MTIPVNPPVPMTIPPTESVVVPPWADLDDVLQWLGVWAANANMGWVERVPLEPPAAYLEHVHLPEMGPGDGEKLHNQLERIGRSADAIRDAIEKAALAAAPAPPGEALERATEAVLSFDLATDWPTQKAEDLATAVLAAQTLSAPASDGGGEDLARRIRAALSDEQPLTGEACEHGWDRAVCVMKGCDNPYALEPLLAEAATFLERRATPLPLVADTDRATGSGDGAVLEMLRDMYHLTCTADDAWSEENLNRRDEVMSFLQRNPPPASAHPPAGKPDAAGSRDDLQQSVAEWCARCFGDDHAASLPQRGIRLAEEAIEAAQSAGCDPAMIHKLVDYVYARPVGDIGQELGGVGVTALALANAAGVSADAEERREVARVLAKPAKHFTERNRAKNEAGFDVTGGYPTTLPAAPAEVE